MVSRPSEQSYRLLPPASPPPPFDVELTVLDGVAFFLPDMGDSSCHARQWETRRARCEVLYVSSGGGYARCRLLVCSLEARTSAARSKAHARERASAQRHLALRSGRRGRPLKGAQRGAIGSFRRRTVGLMRGLARLACCPLVLVVLPLAHPCPSLGRHFSGTRGAAAHWAVLSWDCAAHAGGARFSAWLAPGPRPGASARTTFCRSLHALAR